MHTKDKLAEALNAIGLTEMATKAATGYYHDYLSPLDFPSIQLVNDLAMTGTEEAMALRERVINGEFDASNEEGDEWFNGPEGQDAMRRLMNE